MWSESFVVWFSDRIFSKLFGPSNSEYSSPRNANLGKLLHAICLWAERLVVLWLLTGKPLIENKQAVEFGNGIPQVTNENFEQIGIAKTVQIDTVEVDNDNISPERGNSQTCTSAGDTMDMQCGGAMQGGSSFQTPISSRRSSVDNTLNEPNNGALVAVSQPQEHPLSLGVVVTGRPAMFEFHQPDPVGLITELPRPHEISQLTLFLRKELPSFDHGAAIYWSVPPFSDWQFLGVLTNNRPSDIFQTGWSMNPLVRVLHFEKIEKFKKAKSSSQKSELILNA